jgi:hypothetical protein
VAPLGFDVTTVAVVERLDPARTIGIDMLIDDKPPPSAACWPPTPPRAGHARTPPTPCLRATASP